MWNKWWKYKFIDCCIIQIIYVRCAKVLAKCHQDNQKYYGKKLNKAVYNIGS